MTLVEIIRLPVEPDRIDALVDAVHAGRVTYLSAPRCEEAEVLRAPDGTEVAIVARWASREDHDAAAAEPSSRVFLDDLGRLMAGPPTLGFFTPS